MDGEASKADKTSSTHPNSYTLDVFDSKCQREHTIKNPFLDIEFDQLWH